MFNKLLPSKCLNLRTSYFIQIQAKLLHQKYAAVDDETETSISTTFKKNPFEKPLSIHKRKEKPKIENVENVTIDSDGNLVYTKMQNHDSRVAEILTHVKNKVHRKKKNLMMLEGKRLVKDALQAGCTLSYILFSRKDEVEYIKPYLPQYNTKLYKMPYKEIQMWSNLVTSPGIIGLFKIPEDTSQFQAKTNFPLTVICDNIRDPNNLGAVLRTCGGVGCHRVILTKGCTDVWDPKVLRSAAGCHFKLHIEQSQTWENINESIEKNSLVVIADSNSQQGQSNIPSYPYWDFKFETGKDILLIIGGETEGISEESYKLASDLNGVRLNIPLDNNVESLNTNTALAVFAFEIKRQLNGALKNEKT